MNRLESFKKACLESGVVDCSEIDKIAYDFFELGGYHKVFESSLDSLEEALAKASSEPVKCWVAAIVVLALLQHWQDRARPAKRWLDDLYSRKVPG